MGHPVYEYTNQEYEIIAIITIAHLTINLELIAQFLNCEGERVERIRRITWKF